MKNTHKYLITGMVFGAIAGWCYWYFTGCSSGTCPITSHPFNSTAYGAFTGSVIFSVFKKENNNQQKNK